MSAKAIREATGKDLLNRHLSCTSAVRCRFACVTENTDWRELANEHPWLKTQVCYLFVILFIFGASTALVGH